MLKIKALLPVFLSGFLLFLAPKEGSAAFSRDQKKIYLNALRAPNDALGKNIGDHGFIDQDGKSFEIREFIGKPFIVAFIYTSCPDVCPNILSALVDVVRKAGDRFGGDFRVLAIAFDVENDKPEALRNYGESFTRDFDNWKFVTMKSSVDMRNFADRFGFVYAKTSRGYDHLSMISVVGGDGTLMAHFFGDQLKPEPVLAALDLKVPVKLDLNALSLMDKVLFFCSYYDPASGSYKVDYVLLGQFAVQYILITVTVIFFARKKISWVIKKLFFFNKAGKKI